MYSDKLKTAQKHSCVWHIRGNKKRFILSTSIRNYQAIVNLKGLINESTWPSTFSAFLFTRSLCSVHCTVHTVSVVVHFTWQHSFGMPSNVVKHNDCCNDVFENKRDFVYFINVSCYLLFDPFLWLWVYSKRILRARRRRGSCPSKRKRANWAFHQSFVD